MQEIDAEKASMSVFDTTGLEAYVTENNPKYANKKVRQLKVWAKANGLGIIRAIEFYDKDYFADHPEIERYKKTMLRMKINPLTMQDPFCLY